MIAVSYPQFYFLDRLFLFFSMRVGKIQNHITNCVCCNISIPGANNNRHWVNSKLEYLPGIYIGYKLALILCKQIGFVVNMALRLNLKCAKTSDAISAATIRYLHNVFCVKCCNYLFRCTTNMYLPKFLMAFQAETIREINISSRETFKGY